MSLLKGKFIYQRIKYKLYDKMYIIYTPINKLILRINGITYGKNLRVYGLIFVKNLRGTGEIGDNVTINSASWANPIGCGNKTYIQILNGGKLVIGSNVGLSNVAITCTSEINIDDDVLIGAGVCIYDTDFHSINASNRLGWRDDVQTNVNQSPINIGKRCFIGSGSKILKGCIIHDETIVGAGSIVAGKEINGGMWAGNPAKMLSKNLPDNVL